MLMINLHSYGQILALLFFVMKKKKKNLFTEPESNSLEKQPYSFNVIKKTSDKCVSK